MQPLSFQINQAVLVENDVPYHYDLAKILKRTQNQDQAHEYQIRLYKQKQNPQSKSVCAFKIKKINTQLFNFLKEKCKQFPELAESFKLVQFELSKNQAFIDQEEKDKIWKKLFKKNVLYLQAKKSIRIKYKSIQNEMNQVNLYKNQQKLKNTSLKESKFNVIVQVQISKVNEENTTCRSFKTLSKAYKNSIDSNSKDKKRRKISTSKTLTKLKGSKSLSKNKLNQKILNERYSYLYQFGLKYIAFESKINEVKNYFLQQTQCCNKCQRQSTQKQNLQYILDQLKRILFSLQFNQNIITKDLSSLQCLLIQKLRCFLHNQLNIFPQNITEKIILIIKIYALKKIEIFKPIVVTLQLWLKLFIQVLGKKESQKEEFNAKYRQLKQQSQYVFQLCFQQ